MSKQANKTMIGGFVVGAVALIFAGVMIFGTGQFMKKTYKAVLYFEGSVKGLSVGSPVVFRGVNVGSVESIVIRADASKMSAQIPVIIEIEPDRVELVHGKRDPRKNIPLLIERGLRAQLEMQSFVTGQLIIALDFHPDNPIRLVGDGSIPEIPTIPSTFEQISKKVANLPIEEIFNKLSSAIMGIEKVANSPEVMKIVRSLSLALEEVRKLVIDIDDQVGPLASSTVDTLKAYKKLALNADGQVKTLSTEGTKAIKAYGKLAHDVDAQVEPLASKVDKALIEARAALEGGRKALVAVEDVLADDSPLLYDLDNTLKKFSDMAHSIRLLTDYLKQHPEALLTGKGKSGR
ncbi:MAG: MCE family protein [Deltaproteobacteria bacterium]|nr:MCE family protein [Deltaproteobacteria bacterium]